MRGRRFAVAALLVLAMLLSTALMASASVRMRVTGKRDREAVVLYVPRRATLLASGFYAEALGVPPPPPPDYGYYGGYGGPVYYGDPGYGYGCNGCRGYGSDIYILSPPPFYQAQTRHNSPLPLVW